MTRFQIAFEEDAVDKAIELQQTIDNGGAEGEAAQQEQVEQVEETNADDVDSTSDDGSSSEEPVTETDAGEEEENPDPNNGEVEAVGEVADKTTEAVGDAVGLEAIANLLETAGDTPISAAQAKVVLECVNSIYRRQGIPEASRVSVSTEGFGSGVSGFFKDLSFDKVKQYAKDIWKAIIAAIVNAYKWVKNYLFGFKTFITSELKSLKKLKDVLGKKKEDETAVEQLSKLHDSIVARFAYGHIVSNHQVLLLGLTNSARVTVAYLNPACVNYENDLGLLTNVVTEYSKTDTFGSDKINRFDVTPLVGLKLCEGDVEIPNFFTKLKSYKEATVPAFPGITVLRSTPLAGSVHLETHVLQRHIFEAGINEAGVNGKLSKNLIDLIRGVRTDLIPSDGELDAKIKLLSEKNTGILLDILIEWAEGLVLFADNYIDLTKEKEELVEAVSNVVRNVSSPATGRENVPAKGNSTDSDYAALVGACTATMTRFHDKPILSFLDYATGTIQAARQFVSESVSYHTVEHDWDKLK